MVLGRLLDSFFGLAAVSTRMTLPSFCRIETADDRSTLAAKDGSLVSVLRLDGSRDVMGQAELAEVVERARVSFAPFLQRPGHALQFWFSRDPEAAESEVGRALGRARRHCETEDIDLEDLFVERERHLARTLAWESCYIVLWTRPSIFSKDEFENARRRQKKAGAGAPAYSKEAQWPLAGFEDLRSRHRSLVNALDADIRQMGFRTRILNAHEALRAARLAVYPAIGATSPWTPVLPGDRIPARLARNIANRDDGNDVANLLWPSIASQIFTQDAETMPGSIVRIGDRLFAAADMILAPEQVQPFTSLLNRLQQGDASMPWRVSFLIEGAGLQGQVFKRQLSSIFSWASDDNKRIHAALKDLDAQDLEGETIVRLRCSFATWAALGDEDTLRQRLATLQRAIEGWGNCQASGLVGDPLEGVMSSSLGLDCASTAPAAAAPIAESLAMLPWGRAASPWDEGAIVFRTPDGKPFAYQPGSSRQTTWFDLVYGPPGRGKSVLMNSVNLAAAMAPQGSTGRAALPRIAIIDIGPSSSGLISLLQEALPPRRRHEAAYHRLRMERDHAINPFDTQVGLRSPLPNERAFLVNLLTLLCTPVGEEKPYEGMNQLAGLVVDEVYKAFSEQGGSARPYSAGQDRLVDEAIVEHDIRLPERPLWWEVVDLLAERGLWHEASLAQRYAVPVLGDTALAVRARHIEDIYGATVTPTSETLPVAFQRMISSAIRDLPILSWPTRFDIGGARVCALDLDQVAPRAGLAAERQTAIMYMLARHVLARDFFLNEEDLPSFGGPYRAFHAQRIQDLRESPKRLVYDEFHRTASAAAVREQVRIDIREGRKWGVQICLASQLLSDFDDQMVDQATGIWVCGVGSERGVDATARTFGLNDTARYILRHRLHGPTQTGAPFLAVLELKDGRYQQYLINTLGPIELWALSTTAEDAEIRRRLYRAVGPKRARGLLARAFPSGSAKAEVERRIAAAGDAGNLETEAEAGVIDEIVAELVASGRGVGTGEPARSGGRRGAPEGQRRARPVAA